MLIKRYRQVAATFVVLFAAYLLMIILLPIDKTTLLHYKLTKLQYVGVILTIVIPYLVIGYVAMIGYLRLRYYSESIRKSKDGVAFQTMSNGILWLALWLPVSALAGSAFSGYYRAHPAATEPLVIINNYISIVLLLIAFVGINRGSKKLLSLVRQSETMLPQKIMVLFISFSALYTFLVLNDPARQFPTHTVPIATYYTSDWITVVTIVIPRLVMWYLGVQAVYNIYRYQLKVRGAIYKEALGNLVKGLVLSVISLVALRCFQSLASQLVGLKIGGILLIIYILLILIASGYVLIARGARNLQLIEDV